jgi:ribonuclease HII
MALPFDPEAVGLDEAGRGCLAGPVAAAACRLPAGFDASGILDSKALSPGQRRAAEERLRAEAECVVVLVSPAEIDELNILQASLAGMARAARGIDPAAARWLVDGNACPPGLNAELWVRGDSKRAEIAAASILAKTARDRWMERADAAWPGYGFAGHKGYPSPVHLDALRRLGPCPIHRRSFAPVRELLEQPCLILEG